jgi:hypothetical protein
MALKGNLRDFSVTQLLNLINLAQKTGTLSVEGPNKSARIAFREGKLAYAQMGGEENSLATILYQAKRLTKTQYRIINERAGNMSDKELGLHLINASYISQQDILNILGSHFIEVINRLFTWMEGVFVFELGVLPSNDKIIVRIPLENIIIDGSRRTRELEHLQDEIPSLEMALKFVDRPDANIRNVNLSPEEWRVASYINPKNSIRQIARATKMDDMEIRRVVYSLLQAGLIEIIRPTGIPPIPAIDRQPTHLGTPEEQKSIVNRIIDRIRSI